MSREPPPTLFTIPAQQELRPPTLVRPCHGGWFCGNLDGGHRRLQRVEPAFADLTGGRRLRRRPSPSWDLLLFAPWFCDETASHLLAKASKPSYVSPRQRENPNM